MFIEYLYEFAVLAEHLSFTTAANALFITQPTLSKHIKELECSLGSQLLLRNSHDVKLTDVGQRVLLDAQEIRKHYDNILTCVGGLKKESKSLLRIAIPHISKYEILQNALHRFRETHPEIATSLLSYYECEEMIDDLKRGAIDIVLLPTGSALKTGLQYKKCSVHKSTLRSIRNIRWHPKKTFLYMICPCIQY